MSRAVLKILLAHTIQHEPTDDELLAFLKLCRDVGGDRIFVPQFVGIPDLAACRIRRLRKDGWSIRKIARDQKMSKSQVHRALSQNPDLFRDND